MIIQFHTPKGIVEVETDTVTDIELSALNISRADIESLIRRDALAELDALTTELKSKGVIDG